MKRYILLGFACVLFLLINNVQAYIDPEPRWNYTVNQSGGDYYYSDHAGIAGSERKGSVFMGYYVNKGIDHWDSMIAEWAFANGSYINQYNISANIDYGVIKDIACNDIGNILYVLTYSYGGYWAEAGDPHYRVYKLDIDNSMAHISNYSVTNQTIHGYGIAVDSYANVWVVDGYSSTAYKYDWTGAYTGITYDVYPEKNVNQLDYIRMGIADNVAWVAPYGDNKVIKYSFDVHGTNGIYFVAEEEVYLGGWDSAEANRYIHLGFGVDGYGSMMISSGELKFAPAYEANETYFAYLGEIWEAECKVGDFRCGGTGASYSYECKLIGGHYVWTEYSFCEYGCNQTSGICNPEWTVCINECELGDKRCGIESDGITRYPSNIFYCGNISTSAGYCLQWDINNQTACQNGCELGVCIPDWHQCDLGEFKCVTDDDGNVWSYGCTATDYGRRFTSANKTYCKWDDCQNGKCWSPIDVCQLGESRCSEHGIPPNAPTEWISIQVWCGHLGWGLGWDYSNTTTCAGGCQEYEENNLRKTTCLNVNQTLPSAPVDVGDAPESIKKAGEKLALIFPTIESRATALIIFGLIISVILVAVTQMWQIFPITFLGIFLMGMITGWMPAWVSVIFVVAVGFLLVKSLWGMKE